MPNQRQDDQHVGDVHAVIRAEGQHHPPFQRMVDEHPNGGNRQRHQNHHHLPNSPRSATHRPYLRTRSGGRGRGLRRRGGALLGRRCLVCLLRHDRGGDNDAFATVAAAGEVDREIGACFHGVG